MNPSAPDRTDRQILEVIAENVWPWLALQDEREHRRGLAEFGTIAYSAPLAALGLGWLVVATDLALLRREWLLLLLALLLALLFEQLLSSRWSSSAAASTTPTTRIWPCWYGSRPHYCSAQPRSGSWSSAGWWATRAGYGRATCRPSAGTTRAAC